MQGSYFPDLVAQGATGTDDPQQAGLADFLRNALGIGSAQAGEMPPPQGGAPAQGAYRDPLSAYLAGPGPGPGELSRMFSPLFGAGSPAAPFGGGDPSALPAPSGMPPIPQPPAIPSAPGDIPTPRLAQGGGVPGNVLAMLNAQSPQPFGDGRSMQDLGVRLPIAGQPGSMPQLGAPGPMTGGNPAPAAGAPGQMPPPPSPTAEHPALNPAIGATTTNFANDLRQNALTKYAPLQNQTPNTWDNLMRFGLAAMAAGGKPMATTMGALGEAGVSTIDSNRKFQQQAVENELKNRQVGIQGQGLIAKAYELVDSLQQRSMDRTMSVAAQMQMRQDSNELKALIASGNQSQVQQKIEEIGRHNQELESTRQQSADTATQRQAEQEQRDAATFYQRRRDSMEKQSPLGIDEAAEAKLTAQTARAYPNSNYGREWTATKGNYLDNARQFIAAYPAQRQQAMQKLRAMGIDPREL